jgi:hypothetical protein
MVLKSEIFEELPKDKDTKTSFSPDGFLGELNKALAERVLSTEMDQPSAPSSEAEKAGNRRRERGTETVHSAGPAREFRTAIGMKDILIAIVDDLEGFPGHQCDIRSLLLEGPQNIHAGAQGLPRVLKMPKAAPQRHRGKEI